MISSRKTIVVATLATLAGLAVPASSAAPAAAAAPLSTVTVTGHGYGHGIGMSQYGAKAAALAGVPAARILSAYYPGTTLGSIGNPTMRIRLSALDDKAPVVLPPVGSAQLVGASVTSSTGVRLSLPAGSSWRMAGARTAGMVDVQRPVGVRWGTWARLSGPVTVAAPGQLRVSFLGRKQTCKAGSEVTFAGSMRFQVVDGLPRTTAVLAMESYLRGVVSSESPSSWPAAALQAQAIAARSFAAARRNAARYWDARDSTSDQCWDGASAYTASTDAAVAATAGRALLSGGVAVSAQFSSSNGGWEAPGGRAYLPGRRDPYDVASGNPYLLWRVTVSALRFAGLDGPGGLTAVTGVRVVRRDGQGDWGGRATTVVVDGRTACGAPARITVTGNELRAALGLRSTYFALS
jgi:peptidoglycan hydrolase-like amidase